jgi:hypothetical protein
MGAAWSFPLSPREFKNNVDRESGKRERAECEDCEQVLNRNARKGGSHIGNRIHFEAPFSSFVFFAVSIILYLETIAPQGSQLLAKLHVISIS